MEASYRLPYTGPDNRLSTIDLCPHRYDTDDFPAYKGQDVQQPIDISPSWKKFCKEEPSSVLSYKEHGKFAIDLNFPESSSIAKATFKAEYSKSIFVDLKWTTDSGTNKNEAVNIIDAECTVYKAGEKDGTVLPNTKATLFSRLEPCTKGEMDKKYRNRECQFAFGPYID